MPILWDLYSGDYALHAANMSNGEHAHVPLPPGDDNWEMPAPQGHLPPWMWGQQQHVGPVAQPHKVHLKPLWTGKVRMWFSLAEATFDQYNITSDRMKFNLVLPALSEDTLDRVKGIVEVPERLERPYERLRERLQEVYEPDDWECAARLRHMRELGDMKPSQLMDSMVALLPAGEAPGILFKSIFLSRLPADMRDHVQAKAKQLDPEALAQLADTIWQSRNADRRHVLAAVDKPATEVDQDLVEGVAALNVDKKEKKTGRWTKKRPQARGGGQKSRLICWKHIKYGADAFSCEDAEHCTFNQGN